MNRPNNVTVSAIWVSPKPGAKVAALANPKYRPWRGMISVFTPLKGGADASSTPCAGTLQESGSENVARIVSKVIRWASACLFRCVVDLTVKSLENRSSGGTGSSHPVPSTATP